MQHTMWNVTSRLPTLISCDQGANEGFYSDDWVSAWSEMTALAVHYLSCANNVQMS